MSPVPDLPDADAISAAIATCPSVSGLSGGLSGEIATYLPGRRVSGVRSSPGSVEVHVVARYGHTLQEIDAEVRAAVAAVVPGPLHVDVIVADVEDPFAPVEEPEPPKALEASPSAATQPPSPPTPATPRPPAPVASTPVPPAPVPPTPMPPTPLPAAPGP